MNDSTPPTVTPDLIRGPATPFAKLFETPNGQLLVTKELVDHEISGLAIRYDSPCGISAVQREDYGANDAAEERRDDAFDQFDQAQADAFTKGMSAALDKMGRAA